MYSTHLDTVDFAAVVAVGNRGTIRLRRFAVADIRFRIRLPEAGDSRLLHLLLRTFVS